MQGIEISSLQNTNKMYKYIHYTDEFVEIRSNYEPKHVLDHDIVTRKLPGNLGTYIYPYDSILCFKNGSVINKVIFNKILKDDKFTFKQHNRSNMVFDVPNFHENIDDENDDEIEEERSEGDEEHDTEEEHSDEGEWDEDEVVDFDDVEPESSVY
jgi:hypothetical protein